MKTPLGKVVDLSPGHIALDGVPTLRETGTAAPHVFGPCLLWPRSPTSAAAELLFETCKRTCRRADRQTFRHADCNALHPSLGKVIKHNGVLIDVMLGFVHPDVQR